MSNTLDKSVQREVRALLAWDAQAWAQYVFDCGIAYLQKLMPSYPQVASQISRQQIFWNWWKAHWEKRDMEFLEKIDESQEAIIDPVAEYRELHDPRTLAEAIYLNGQVLEESYAEMFGKLSDEQIKRYREVAA